MMAQPPMPGMPPAMGAGASPMAARPMGGNSLAFGPAPPPPPAGGGGAGLPQMLAQLAQRGQSGQLPPEVMTVLTFLAGMGFEPFSRATDRLKPKEAAGPTGGPGAPGGPIQQDAMGAAPGAAPNPQMAQLAALLAARRGAVPGMNPMGAPPMMPRMPMG